MLVCVNRVLNVKALSEYYIPIQCNIDVEIEEL